MPDFDPDPEMMRKQQNLDMPEPVAQAEEPREIATDSDARSCEDRRGALAGGIDGEGQMQAILRQNRAGISDDTTISSAPAVAGHKQMGLVRAGRSLLGG
ncbi:hypothetical protein LQ948_07980 [Jiella sp. MQZ9-1]|uniref:Uncharacterized protein n=1 Tax=Jiella flava TaxID=2816857 RepID=A0A939FYV6_9HYPH|nr:hypothetical protein [Jiella flava]MBO0662725.1 hypothetical protein [Jiella flava]MCD2471147.1 hypothetical protein [Jiella flava]